MIGVGIALVAVFLVIGTCIIALNAHGQRQRDQELVARWDGLCAQRDSTPGAVMIEVIDVYQRAQRGTKAIVVVAGSGRPQDAWFWGTRPAPHSTWLVMPETGWGPHNQNPVLYLNPEQLLGMAPPGTMKAVERRKRIENVSERHTSAARPGGIPTQSGPAPSVSSRFPRLHPPTGDPISLDDVEAPLWRDVARVILRHRPTVIWTADDMEDLEITGDIRRFPSALSMIEAMAKTIGTREFYHVKRDGMAMVLLLLRETTFDALADHPDFRYMVKHKRDSNLRIVVARNPSRV